MDGWTELRTDGRTDRRTDGTGGGRTVGRTHGRNYGWTDGTTDERTDGRTNVRTDGPTDGSTQAVYTSIVTIKSSNQNITQPGLLPPPLRSAPDGILSAVYSRNGSPARPSVRLPARSPAYPPTRPPARPPARPNHSFLASRLTLWSQQQKYRTAAVATVSSHLSLFSPFNGNARRRLQPAHTPLPEPHVGRWSAGSRCCR